MKENREKPDIGYGLLLALLAVVTVFNICIFSYIGCEMVPWLMAGGFDAVAEQQVAQPTPIPQTPTPAPTPPINEDNELSFEIVAGEAGNYGKPVTYNEGTEFEETVYGYYVPPGQYTATNTGEYTSQINVYSDETTITDAGWEEAAETHAVERLNVGQSADIVVGNNQHIEIAESSAFKLELISTELPAVEPVTPDPTKAPEPTKTPETPSPATATPAPSQSATSGAYVGSTEKTIYHYPHCRHAKKILKEHEIWFDTVEEAIADGRRACQVCYPPESS